MLFFYDIAFGKKRCQLNSKFAPKTIVACVNADFKPPARVHGANTPYWFGCVMRPSRATAVPGYTRVRYLQPTAAKATTFKAHSEVNSFENSVLVPVPASCDASGTFTIPAAAEAFNPNPGDASSRTPRSALLGWNDHCEICSKGGSLVLCEYCNLAICSDCKPEGAAAATWTCGDCEEELR